MRHFPFGTSDRRIRVPTSHRLADGFGVASMTPNAAENDCQLGMGKCKECFTSKRIPTPKDDLIGNDANQ